MRFPCLIAFVALVVLAQPARAVDEPIAQPMRSIGAALLIAAMAGCVAPVVLEAVAIAEWERPPIGILTTGYLCGGLGLGGGLAYALTDVEQWQQNVGIAAASIGVVALTLTAVAHSAPERPSVSVLPTLLRDSTNGAGVPGLVIQIPWP